MASRPPKVTAGRIVRRVFRQTPTADKLRFHRGPSFLTMTTSFRGAASRPRGSPSFWAGSRRTVVAPPAHQRGSWPASRGASGSLARQVSRLLLTRLRAAPVRSAKRCVACLVLAPTETSEPLGRGTTSRPKANQHIGFDSTAGRTRRALGLLPLRDRDQLPLDLASRAGVSLQDRE